MTKQELSHHAELRQRLTAAVELLKSLEAAAQPAAQRLDGMPRTPGINDRVGNLAAAIADAKDEISKIESTITKSEKQIMDFINTIDDLQTRMIFRLRFLEGLSWKEVAAIIGGRNTEDGVKSSCYRYMSRHL